MCFSAEASFAGGAIITSIGLISVLTNRERSRRVFAAIPLVFGFQQISEGFVWLALQSPGHELSLKVPSYIFLITAVVIWPTLVPLSILCLEKLKKRKNLLWVSLAVGLAVSLVHGIGLLVFQATAQISGHHILYATNSPTTLTFATNAAYLVATIPPLFLSSQRGVRWFGVIIVLAYAATQIFFAAYLVSVWCFFAALASLVVWLIVRKPISPENPGDQSHIMNAS
jgi:hypothetical protein